MDELSEAKKKLLVFFSHGEKGGVGKTAVATAAIELLAASGQRVAVIEGDVDNADVFKRYEKNHRIGPFAQIRLADPSEYQRSINNLANFLAEIIEKDSADAVVVNMPAGAVTTVDRDVGVLKSVIEDLEIDVVVAVSSGNTEQSILATEKIVKEGIGTIGKCFVIAPEFLKDEALEAKLNARGLPACTYPRVSPDTMQMILDHPDTSLHEMTIASGPIKSPIQRIRVAEYLRGTRNKLAPEFMGMVKSDVFGSK